VPDGPLLRVFGRPQLSIRDPTSLGGRARWRGAELYLGVWASIECGLIGELLRAGLLASGQQLLESSSEAQVGSVLGYEWPCSIHEAALQCTHTRHFRCWMASLAQSGTTAKTGSLGSNPSEGAGSMSWISG